jgi:hypothetical protein
VAGEVVRAWAEREGVVGGERTIHEYKGMYNRYAKRERDRTQAPVKCAETNGGNKGSATESGERAWGTGCPARWLRPKLRISTESSPSVDLIRNPSTTVWLDGCGWNPDPPHPRQSLVSRISRD